MASTSGQSHLPSQGQLSFAGHVKEFALRAEILHFTKKAGSEEAKSQRERKKETTKKTKKESKKEQEKKKRQEEWRHFLKAFLRSACGARNTPVGGSSIQPQLPRKKWWQYEIKLVEKMKGFDYTSELSDRVDNKLLRLLSPRSSYSDVFLVVPSESVITYHVASSDKEFATMDYKTKQSTNKGLEPVNAYGLDSICYELYQKEAIDTPSLPKRSKDMTQLEVGKKLGIYEDARLQFKRLQKGQTVNNKIETGEEEEDESFDPEKPADHYDEWIWTKYPRGLGEYVSAFSKIEEGGGAIYYGINETEDNTGYEPAGLVIDAAKMEAIKEGIRHKIRHEMLWIQRDQEAEDGYKELKSEEIRCQGETASDQEHCHFAVDFIEVKEPSSSQSNSIIPTQQPSSQPTQQPSSSQPTQQPSSSQPTQQPSSSQQTQQPSSSQLTQQPSSSQLTQQPSSSQAKYVLEVRVAPFNGVVFYDPQGPEAYRMEEKGDPQGPEAYRMEKKGEEFEPVRVSKEEWLKMMRDYGWCSKHKISKKVVCTQCESDSEQKQTK